MEGGEFEAPEMRYMGPQAPPSGRSSGVSSRGTLYLDFSYIRLTYVNKRFGGLVTFENVSGPHQFQDN